MNLNEITVLIKSFERVDALERCLRSVRKLLPGVGIIICDDSRELPNISLKENEEIHHIGFDQGLAKGRNILLCKCKTPYFLLMDDDTYLIECNLDKISEALKSFDIVGGIVDGIPWRGMFKLKNYRLIHLYDQYEKDESGYKKYDFIPNFFVGKTEEVAAVGWDNELKVSEHSEFFTRAQGVLRTTQIETGFRSSNCRDRNEFYDRCRSRTKHFGQIEHKKIGIKFMDFVNPDKIKALVIKNPAVYDHPNGFMEEFQERLGNGNNHSIDYVWESDINDRFPWYKYNLIICNFTWVGPRERPKSIRCVYINDDLHWNGNDKARDNLLENIDAADLFFNPYARHMSIIPEFDNYITKSVEMPFAVPWWFEPGQWAERSPTIACSGGLHPEVYPLRTDISLSDDECVAVIDCHPGYSMKSNPHALVRNRYSAWMNQHMGGLATMGYGRFPSGNREYLVAKYVEVAACTCPFFEEIDGLKELGFKPYVNYVPIDNNNWRHVFRDWLDRPDDMRDIFLNSSALITERHCVHHRVNYFWKTIKERFGWQ